MKFHKVLHNLEWVSFRKAFCSSGRFDRWSTSWICVCWCGRVCRSSPSQQNGLNRTATLRSWLWRTFMSLTWNISHLGPQRSITFCLIFICHCSNSQCFVCVCVYFFLNPTCQLLFCCDAPFERFQSKRTNFSLNERFHIYKVLEKQKEDKLHEFIWCIPIMPVPLEMEF